MKRPLSMTSFGQGEKSSQGLTWTVEVRTVNHRYCDIHLKLPRRYGSLEERIKKEVGAYHARGHIDVALAVTGEQAAPRLEVNLPLAREYYQGLEKLYRELALPAPPDLAMLVTFKDLLTPVEQEEDPERVWPLIREALTGALEKAMAMRQREGELLQDDLLARIAGFSQTLDQIEQAVPLLLERKRAALKERLDNLLAGVDIDPARLAQEVAIMADKTDITEELVRLRSHIQQFRGFLQMDEPVGRRLDFLLQEFMRETNTIASKISDAAVAHQTVELKNEAEKMREQVQNLE